MSNLIRINKTHRLYTPMMINLPTKWHRWYNTIRFRFYNIQKSIQYNELTQQFVRDNRFSCKPKIKNFSLHKYYPLYQ